MMRPQGGSAEIYFRAEQPNGCGCCDTHKARAMRKMNQRIEYCDLKGFSLVEVAVVLVIVGLLVAGVLTPLAEQRQQLRITQANAQAETIMEALLGYAVSQGHLPCPATNTSNGLELVFLQGLVRTRCGNATVLQHGFVPSATLGLSGDFNEDGLMMDPWGNPWRYSITPSDSTVPADGVWDFISPGQLRDVTMAGLQPNLVVCDAASAGATGCDAGDTTLADSAVVVVFSMGRDWQNYTSADQQENAGEPGSTALGGFPMAAPNNLVFVSRANSVRQGAEFDDLVFWLSPNVLYSRMLKAGQLP